MKPRVRELTASLLQELMQPFIDRRAEYQRLDGESSERVKAIDIEIAQIDSQLAQVSHDPAPLMKCKQFTGGG